MKRGFKVPPAFTVSLLWAVLLCAAGVNVVANQFDTPSGITYDLYKVVVQSHDDAEALSAAKVDVLLRVQDGYLVLAGSEDLDELARTGLKFDMIAAGVARNHLALDIRLDESNVGRYPLVYREDGVRLFRVEPSDIYGATKAPGLAPILTENLRVVYKEPRPFLTLALSAEVNLDSLIDLIDQDSLESYLERLQAFRERSAGTDSNYASRDWIAGKLTDFGYDSVVIDSFTAVIGSYPTECQNVVAYKIGTTYPEFQVVVGAHRDAVPGSPGADDNGTGTVGVLEIARVLKDIDTRLTFIFILFDA
ncbi:MAG: M28 family peptidase [Candidatus Zixiibacteriota bacterium]|nr:MAG: M28 family peptidase [candidate division Zixibacteria bacterium]